MSVPSMVPDKAFKFRAGISEFDETTKVCTPLAVQGVVKVSPNAEGSDMGFWDFEWKPVEKRLASTYEPIQLILIPGETVWTQIKSATEGRVFALIFSSNQKYFFWMQERSKGTTSPEELTAKDKDVMEKIDSILSAQIFDEDEDEMEVLEDADATGDHEPDTDMKEVEHPELA